MTSDQIKKCNIELENQRIKFELNSVEAATKVIENMNNKVVQEQKVTAYQDITQTKVASPNQGPLKGAGSSSPPQITAQLPETNSGFMHTATH